MPRVLAVSGPSGSGKTTLLTALIRHLSQHGARVAAIKHTHHPVNDERRGDTQAFLDAGAVVAILAGDHAATLFTPSSTSPIDTATLSELIPLCADADVIFIEGFKDVPGRPRIDTSLGVPTVTEALEILDRIAPP